jgi:peptidylprolyl isomerase
MTGKIQDFQVFIFITLSLILSATTSANQWRALEPEKTVLMILPQGNVVIELAPQFSPNHVEQFRRLVKSGHYNGNKFYRVIDGFVAQAGPADQSFKDVLVPTLAIEGEWLTDKSWQFTPVQNNDLFAEQTGFKDGFALGRNPSENKAWLLHCPGVIAMARSNQPNSASSHFYITNGQAPRYLDRIMTVFGRVVYGMNHVQTITRTSVIEGEEPVPESNYTSILSMQMMNDVDKKDQILLDIEQTEHPNYQQKLAERRARKNAFFYKKPPPVLDICQTPVLTRIAKKTTQYATD